MGNIKPWKMMMLRGGQDEEDGERRPGMEYMPPEGRRRNDHYPRTPDVGMRRRRDGGEDYPRTDMRRRMGFGEEPDDISMRRRRGAYAHGGSQGEEYDSEPIRFGGMIAMDEPWKHRQMTREMAMEWVDGMENADPSKPHGGKWTPEQVKAHAAKMGFPTEGAEFWEFFAVMNAMYSDYFEAAKRFNLQGNPEFFAELAKAWLNDKDAVENKAAMYYECIVAE